MRRGENLPSARRERLVVKALEDELLIYDLDSHRAYCLNRTAALIWNACDGRRTVKEMARFVEKEGEHPVDESFVLYGLNQLSRFKLLEERTDRHAFEERMTRRELARRLGFATAALIPLISAIEAPTAAQASTCRAVGDACTTNSQCCTFMCISGTCMCIDNQGPCDPNQPQQCCSGRCGSANQKCLP